MPFAEKQADEYCEAYARAHRDDKIQYLIGSGNLWGPTYSYAMCIMEEMQWMRTKSVTAGDFFHGTLEVIERDDTVLLFFGEDESLELTHKAQSRRVFAAGAIRTSATPLTCSNSSPMILTLSIVFPFDLQNISQHQPAHPGDNTCRRGL